MRINSNIPERHTVMIDAQLVNDPFGDPAVYVSFRHRRGTILFDLGEIEVLSPRQILKLDHIFVSHTHMDHFIGFDRLLRICLGRDKHLRLYGPSGFIRSLENKINAYSWNLVENYTSDFVIHATEIDDQGNAEIRRYRCQKAFRREGDVPVPVSHGVMDTLGLYADDFLSVSCVFLDHMIPCLAFRLEERCHVNIMSNKLEEMGLPVGPWLTELKERILCGDPGETLVPVWWREAGQRVDAGTVPLKRLMERAVRITRGETLAYVTDAIYHPDNIDRILAIARDVDHLFIEGSFFEAESQRAKEKYHLTAAQAGSLARQAGVKCMTLFHFSPKHHGQGEKLIQEALAAFKGHGGVSRFSRSSL